MADFTEEELYGEPDESRGYVEDEDYGEADWEDEDYDCDGSPECVCRACVVQWVEDRVDSLQKKWYLHSRLTKEHQLIRVVEEVEDVLLILNQIDHPHKAEIFTDMFCKWKTMRGVGMNE